MIHILGVSLTLEMFDRLNVLLIPYESDLL
jgi:hypothetical protein